MKLSTFLKNSVKFANLSVNLEKLWVHQLEPEILLSCVFTLMVRFSCIKKMSIKSYENLAKNIPVNIHYSLDFELLNVPQFLTISPRSAILKWNRFESELGARRAFRMAYFYFWHVKCFQGSLDSSISATQFAVTTSIRMFVEIQPTTVILRNNIFPK